MTYIIGMVSQKGGAGKSTLARAFAREAAADDFAVKIADLDTQQTTCAEWAADRAEAGIEPEIQVQAYAKIETALREASRFDAFILDGRPHSSDQTMQIAKAADAIVIPTGQTKDDARPAVKAAHSLADAGIPEKKIAFAAVKTTNSQAEATAAREYLDQTDYTVLEGHLPVSTAYGTAHDVGRAVTETTHKSANVKAEAAAQSMIDRAAAAAPKQEVA